MITMYRRRSVIPAFRSMIYCNCRLIPFQINRPSIFSGTQMTFYELRNQVLRMANALGALGISKGDRVGIHLPNCPQYPIAYYAALSLGAIVVNLNPMYTTEELTALTGNTGISTLITFDLALPSIRTLCQTVLIPRVIVTKVTDYMEGMGPRTPDGFGSGKRMVLFFLFDR